MYSGCFFKYYYIDIIMLLLIALIIIIIINNILLHWYNNVASLNIYYIDYKIISVYTEEKNWEFQIYQGIYAAKHIFFSIFIHCY